jgi:predicted metal-dependent phosphotriesterase family hydrolase
MAEVQTTSGRIPATSLGIVDAHEHLFGGPPSPFADQDPDLVLDSVEAALKELDDFARAGGQTLVDATAIDYGRNTQVLVEVSKRTPVKVVACTGFNKGRFHPAWVRDESADSLAEFMVKEVLEGIDDSGIKAGLLKTGSWYNVISPEERKVTIALARAHRLTNAPIYVHTEIGTMGLEQLDILEEEKVDLGRVVVGHMDRNPDFFYHREIARRGALLAYDGISKIKYYPESVRVELVKRMIEAGYGDQIVLGGDMARRSYMKGYGGGPGWDYILKKFVPRLLAEGLSKIDVDKLLIHNPAAWLSM